ncbi:MAG: polysaccharide deacetylase family protein [Chloroflexi bacterium]|nr:polysaccharide deacetylase family protein [Chloroflexota bacterium]
MLSDNQPQISFSAPTFSCDLQPEQIQAGESVRVRVKNEGQSDAIFIIRGRSRGINFEPAKEEIELKAGQSKIVAFRPKPSSPPIIGDEKKYSFRIQVRSSSGSSQILKGKVLAKARFSLPQALLLFFFVIFSYFSVKASTPKVLAILATDTPTPTITPLPTITPTPRPHEGEILYLSFDDGPSIQWTEDILNILDEYDAKATFFIIGEKAKEHPEVIHAIEKGGHSIGHHSWAHTSLNGIGFDAFANEVRLTNAVLPNGAAACIRLPFADEGYYTEDHAANLGLEIIWWDIDPLDWQSPGQKSIENTVLSEVEDEAIILLHDGGGNRSQTVAALENIMQELNAQGYRFETLCDE